MHKPNLIFIPGWNIRAEIFKPFTYALENKLNCHLLTPVTGGDYLKSISEFKNYIEHNQLKELHVLGWSMGGQLAILLAQQLKIEKLYLMSTAAIFSRKENDKKSFYELCQKDFQRAVKYFHKLMGSLSLEDSILLKNNFIDDRQNALNYLRCLHEYDLTAEAKKINCPVVVMHAREDKIIPFSEAEYLLDLMPQSVLIDFLDDFHFPFLKHYAKITRTILEKQG